MSIDAPWEPEFRGIVHVDMYCRRNFFAEMDFFVVFGSFRYGLSENLEGKIILPTEGHFRGPTRLHDPRNRKLSITL